MQKANPLERFHRMIRIESNGCWIWIGSTAKGYGKFRDENTVYVLSHRWSYEYYKGAIPIDLHIDHLCRTPLCVNPDHLEAVSRKENNQRRKVSYDEIKEMYSLILISDLVSTEEQKATLHHIMNRFAVGREILRNIQDK